MSRRRFGALSIAGAAPEVAFALHAAVQGTVPTDTVWLNANENPEGPPPEAKEAISRAISEVGRYNHRAFPALHEVLAHLTGVETDEVMPGAGSTEVLHCAGRLHVRQPTAHHGVAHVGNGARGGRGRRPPRREGTAHETVVS
jgi:histidinol-phosphate/aromatic aminotransferase/cobyric acid decarboxylase-like protein